MIRLVPLVVVLGLVLSLTGCGSKSTPDNSVSVNTDTTSVKPLPSEYRVLAENLAGNMKASPEDFRDTKGFSENIAEGHLSILALREIKSQDSDITYIANLGQTAFGDAVSRLERLNAFPKPPGAELLVEQLVHLLYGNAIYAYGLGRDAEEKQKVIMGELKGLQSAADKADAISMMLPRIAEKYAAKQSDPKGHILVNIDESWGWFRPNDWFYIFNAGPALEDCTIQVFLTGGTGQARNNVHFVRHWPANSWMCARYERGETLPDGSEFGRSTVTAIQKAEVSIWSPKYTTKLTYVYQGAEKDNDIAKWCKDLKFTGSFKPFVPGYIWNDERGAEFTLDGVAMIPKCKVGVTFRKGWQSKTWYWDHDSWTKGEKKSFYTSKGDLTFDPSHIDMAITFPGTSYTHKITLPVER